MLCKCSVSGGSWPSPKLCGGVHNFTNTRIERCSKLVCPFLSSYMLHLQNVWHCMVSVLERAWRIGFCARSVPYSGILWYGVWEDGRSFSILLIKSKGTALKEENSVFALASSRTIFNQCTLQYQVILKCYLLTHSYDLVRHNYLAGSVLSSGNSLHSPILSTSRPQALFNWHIFQSAAYVTVSSNEQQKCVNNFLQVCIGLIGQET